MCARGSMRLGRRQRRSRRGGERPLFPPPLRELRHGRRRAAHRRDDGNDCHEFPCADHGPYSSLEEVKQLALIAALPPHHDPPPPLNESSERESWHPDNHEAFFNAIG